MIHYDIDPELKSICRNIPFTERGIRIAKPIINMSRRTTRLAEGTEAVLTKIEGYNDEEIDVEIFRNGEYGGERPCLLYLHGGGFGYPAAAHHRRLASIYAKETGCVVVMPDYHLLPESPYPAARVDAERTYMWIYRHSKALGIDRNRIGVTGDSAGAILTTYVCAMDNGIVSPCMQMLVYPATDYRMNTESMRKYTDTPIWNTVNNQNMWEMYLSNISTEQYAEASPAQVLERLIEKKGSDLAGFLPVTYIETAEYDCLHDEGTEYARCLGECGVEVELHDTKGTIHGYDNVIGAAVVKENIKNRIRFIKKAFSNTTPEDIGKLRQLIEQGTIELFVEDGVHRLVYLMNDAVESFLILENARINGEYDEEFEGETEAELRKEKYTYVLVVHQGETNAFTIRFTDVKLETKLYDYGEVGHFWLKGNEHLRQLEFRLAIIRDKYKYLGESVCTKTELKLAELAGFPPIAINYPAIPEKYRTEEIDSYVASNSSIKYAIELAERVEDEVMEKALRHYGHTKNRAVAKWYSDRIAAMLADKKHRLFVLELENEIRNAGTQYRKRRYTPFEDEHNRKRYEKAHSRCEKINAEGGCALVYKEEPFVKARDDIEYKAYVLEFKENDIVIEIL